MHHAYIFMFFSTVDMANRTVGSCTVAHICTAADGLLRKSTTNDPATRISIYLYRKHITPLAIGFEINRTGSKPVYYHQSFSKHH